MHVLRGKKDKNKITITYIQMTKADIINKIAESTGLQKKDVSVVVESFMENIKDSL